MKINFSNILCSCIFLLLSIAGITAKENPSRISGTVVSDANGTPVDFATVLLVPAQLHSMTDKDGKFLIENVPSGKTTLTVQFFGMETIDTTFTVSPGVNYHFHFNMKETSFRLDNVVVTATQSKAGKSTASNISRQAMDHIQTSSIMDVMSLLPGVDLSNPSLSSAQNITIRTASSSRMNSLGTAVLVDGAPLSNNANMQTLSPVIAGSMTSETGGGRTGYRN